MKIICFNCTWLGRPLAATGHDVVLINSLPEGKNPLPPKLWTIDGLIRTAGMTPDVILLELWGNRPFLAGIETSPCPVVAMTLDATLNAFWLEHYLRLTDLAFVDQLWSRDRFAARGINAHWMPLSVPEPLVQEPAREKEHDIVFVGRIGKDRLKRFFLLYRLEEHYRIKVVGRPGDPLLTQREMVKLFARSRIVLNENLFDGLTMRVFQGLASGALLLTEHTENGLTQLFTPDTHLATFTPSTLQATLERYLKDETLRSRVAEAGRAELLAKHTTRHRLRQLLEGLDALPRHSTRRPPDLLSLGLAYLYAGRRFDDQWPRLQRLAGACLQQCLEPGRPPREQGLAHLGLGRLHVWTSPPRVDTAISHLRRAVSLLPEDADALLALAHALRLKGEERECLDAIREALEKIEEPSADSKDVLDGCRRELEKQPGPGLWMALGELFLSLGKSWEHGMSKQRPEELPENAAEYFHLALRQGGGARAHKGLGRAYMAVGVMDQALMQFMAGLEEAPHDAELNALASVASKAVYLPGAGEMLRRRSRSL